MASLKVRLKWRSESGPVDPIVVYLLVCDWILFLPLGSMLGSSSSSPKICASSVNDNSTSNSFFPASFPASPFPSSSPGCPLTGSPSLPSPWPTPPCLSPNLNLGVSICGIGIVYFPLPLGRTVSPWEIYFRKLSRILPLTILRNLLWSRLIGWSTL